MNETYKNHTISRFDGAYMVSFTGPNGMNHEKRGFGSIQAAKAWIDETERLEEEGKEILAAQ